MGRPPFQLALTLSYDGSDFFGSQVQPGRRTVQDELERALAALYGAPPPVVFAGRTDRGVHAAGQVVSLPDPRPDLEPATVRAALNARLPTDLVVVAARRRPFRFNARYDARWREYRYRIWSGGHEPLAARQVWMRSARLDLAAMARAAMLLHGEHDFASFAGGGEGVPWSPRQAQPRGTRRTLFASEVRRLTPWWRGEGAGELFEYRVVGDGFLPQMVRALISAVAEVGRGTRPTSWIADLLEAKDRRAGAGTAPPSGLTLWQVGYEAFGSAPAQAGAPAAAASNAEE